MVNRDFCPEEGYSVTPSDSASNPGYGFVCGADGNVSILTPARATLVLTGLKAGVQYAQKFRRINATGTTATGIVAYYR